MTGPRVVAIGGGHGLATSLRAVRTYAGHLTAVVATGDDGGSSGRLRAALDMPAPGDLRRCLTAMAADQSLAAALEHRFGRGELAGHAVGNLVLAGLYDAGHDLLTAAEHVSSWLGIGADVRVLPATHGPVDMVATTDGGEVRGQVSVEGTPGITKIAMDPPDPSVPTEVLSAIGEADQVILGPGSFFTSVLAAAVVPAIRKAIDVTSGRVVFVANLRADEVEVAGFDLGRHVDALLAHGIRPDVVLTQQGGLPLGTMPGGVELVVADVDRPHGLAHDRELLGRALAELR